MLSLIERMVFLLVLLLALFMGLREMARKYKLILKGKAIKRFDQPLRRVTETAGKVFFQIPVISQRPVTGFFHAVIFYGFFVFLFVTINHFFEGFFQDFTPLGQGMVYKAILFGANVFAGLIIVAIFYFIIRRYVFRPAGLDIPSWQSLIVLTFIFTLMVSFIFYEAFKLYAPAYHRLYSHANFLAHLAWRALPAAAPASTSFWLHSLWWLHILAVMAFGVFIFYSKHLHLVAGPINILFRNRGIRSEIPLVNLEEQEKFGMPHIRDLSRKDLLDLFSCAECGRCENVCPAFSSGKKLSPKELLEKLKQNLLESEKALAAAGGELKVLLGQVISDAEAWDCTTCAACMEVCPMKNEHIPKIMGMRQYGVLQESRFPEEFQTLYRGLENQGNPWGIGAAGRSEWAKDLDIPLLAEKGQTDTLLWVGCAGSYDQHSQGILKALVKILKKAGVDFAYLGNEETCCGDPARRTGMEYLFQILARQNIETLNRYRFNRMVTACPHGYHVLKNEYPQMGGHYQVLHHSQLLAELLQQGKIALKNNLGEKVAFHDPCYLGRYNEIYEEPRQALKQVPGLRIREMANSRKTSFCCGGGGGGMWKEEKVGERISHLRVRQAQKTGADNLVTACPFCSIMFKDAINETNTIGLKTKDLSQLLLEHLE